MRGREQVRYADLDITNMSAHVAAYRRLCAAETHWRGGGTPEESTRRSIAGMSAIGPGMARRVGLVGQVGLAGQVGKAGTYLTHLFYRRT